MAISPSEIIDSYHFRHACKEFDAEKKIPAEIFDTILQTGRLSPSSFGFEPWLYLIVQQPTLREKLREVTWGGQKQIPTASHLIVILARKSHYMRYDSDYITHMMRDVMGLPEAVMEKKREVYRNFQQNDFKLLESERAMFDWACKQTYIALGNMMTTAAMLGVDSCPIEGFDREKIEAVLRDHLSVETDKFGISCMVAFGYRVREGRPKTRQPIEEITRWFS